jgi:hypothetical protein
MVGYKTKKENARIRLAKVCLANPIPTPSNHRTQLGPMAQISSRLGTGGYRNSASLLSKAGPSQTPSHRQPFTSLDSNTLNRPSVSGYGMSAGMKIGKQASKKSSSLVQLQAHTPLNRS